jgi:hypothetical protein
VSSLCLGTMTFGKRPSGASRLGEDPDRGMEAYDRRGTDYPYGELGVDQRSRSLPGG